MFALKRICWKYFNYMRQRLGYKPKKTNILWLQPSLALQKSWFLYKQYWSIILTAFDQIIIYFLEKKVLVTVAIFLFMSGAFSMQYYFHILFKREKYIASLFLYLKKLIFKSKQTLEFPVKNCSIFFSSMIMQESQNSIIDFW